MFDRVHTTRLSVALAMALTTLAIAPAAMADPIGLQCSDGILAGNTRTFNLTADKGTMETPDGNSNLMWSYRQTGTVASPGAFQTPGPILCANQDEVVHVNLTNTLSEATSVVFPGQKGVTTTGGAAGTFAREAAATNGTVSYEFTASSPGTFVYESGTDPAKQVEMGLASALIVRPDTHPTWAYGAARTEFNSDNEYILILSEIDPELHSAVENGEPYDIQTLHNRYFTINGRAFPDTLQDNDVPWLPTQPYGSLVKIKPFNDDPLRGPLNTLPSLLRIVNLGLDPHPFHPHGQSLRQVGNDGHLVATTSGGDAATERFAETLPSGATEDYLLSYTDQDNFSPSNPSPGADAIPGYQDVAIKDANTWYSGSPYLGTVGDLPDGTVSQNLCGAFYFPWHSHALNEFANFEAAFGGMATMLRVDPLVGCADPGLVTRTAAPNSVTLLGSGNSALLQNVNALATADGNRYTVTSNLLTSPRATDWYGQFNGVPGAGVQNLKVAYTGRNRRLIGSTNTFTCSQLVRIFRWTDNTWVTLNSQANLDARGTNAGNTIALTNLAAPGANDQVYVSGAGQIRVRVGCSAPNPNQAFTQAGDLMQITYDAP